MLYSSAEKVVIRELKADIKRTEKAVDKNETPDELATDLACFYRVLNYYMTYTDYHAFVQKRKFKRNKKGK